MLHGNARLPLTDFSGRGGDLPQGVGRRRAEGFVPGRRPFIFGPTDGGTSVRIPFCVGSLEWDLAEGEVFREPFGGQTLECAVDKRQEGAPGRIRPGCSLNEVGWDTSAGKCGFKERRAGAGFAQQHCHTVEGDAVARFFEDEACDLNRLTAFAGGGKEDDLARPRPSQKRRMPRDPGTDRSRPRTCGRSRSDIRRLPVTAELECIDVPHDGQHRSVLRLHQCPGGNSSVA